MSPRVRSWSARPSSVRRSLRAPRSISRTPRSSSSSTTRRDSVALGRSSARLAGPKPPCSATALKSASDVKSMIVPFMRRDVLILALSATQWNDYCSSHGLTQSIQPQEKIMTVLVTGSTGVVGKQGLDHLNGSGVEVRALTRSPEKAHVPAGVTAVKGDLSDIDAVRRALSGVSTVFVLAPNAADELTQALQTLSVAREGGVKGIVYLSVFKGAEYVDVPHFTGKHTVERMIEHTDLPATVLRPAYFIQNDVRQKDPLLTHGVYGMPIGSKGISMVNVRDIGEAAARELLRRERAARPLPRATYELVGPDVINAQT